MIFLQIIFEAMRGRVISDDIGLDDIYFVEGKQTNHFDNLT